MQLVIDEQEREHIFVCLKEGKAKFSKIKTDLERMMQPTDHIEEALLLNQKLQREFNPKAEEEARAASRKRDPAQMDLEDQVRSHARRLERRARTLNQTDGVPEEKPAGEPLTDFELQSKLGDGDCFLTMEDIAGWTSSEREAASDWARRGGAKGVPVGEGWPSGTPACITDVLALREHELDELIGVGPYRVEEREATVDGETVTLYDVGQDVESGDGAERMEGWDVDTTFDNDIDADVRAARLNKGMLPEPSLKDESLEKLKELGIGDGAPPAETPSAETAPEPEPRTEAAPAFEYPRDGWTEQQPMRVTEDQVQAVRAAAEAK